MTPNIEELKAKGKIRGLVKALGNEDVDVRKAAADALGEIGDARAVEPLATAMQQDKDVDVRKAAVKALDNINDPRAAALLQQHATLLLQRRQDFFKNR